ncbi:MAG: InlB B-repeat-containing protein, partial [Clostridiales Family XIII bacterium]|nr:InlB B-repeat-containing protein [Clostridiales Family XIII bacterium]
GTTFDDKGHYKLKPHDILYVEYSMGFDLSAIEANAALKTLYSDNNLKVAVNNYTPYYQVILEEGGSQMLTDDGFLKSNDVAVRLAAPRVSVSGETWEDMNYNGLKDGPLDTADPLYEKPTGGVSVTLYRRVNGGAVTLVTAEMSSDPLFESTVKTGADGKYIFHGLESSYNTGIEYMVQFGLPDGDGWLRTLKDAPGGTSLPDAASDANDSDAMQSGLLAGNTDWYTVNTDRDNIWAGYNKLGVLNGMAWYDYNGDGIQDASETDYAAGVKVSLYTSAAAAEAGGATGADYVASAVTGTDGKYSFGNLMAVKQGTSTPAAYHVRFDKSDLKADAMTYNWTAELQDTDRQKDSDPSPFDMALPGYTADYSVPVAVTKNAANVPYGGTTSYVDAGLLPVTKAIGGYVWTDKNYDGIQNGPGLSPPAPEPELYESPISGVAVELYGSSDSGASWDSKPVATAVTGANGRFEFTGPDGDPTAGLSFGVGKAYRIKILKPDDTWYYTLKDQGSDDDKDSDVFDTGTDAGFSATITEPMVNLGAGLYQLGEISGKVWFDQNGDGSKAGETFDPKPAGVTAKLYTSADGTTGWAEKASKLVTATDDDFTFAELKSGHYKVVFDRTGLTSSTETYLWTVPNAPGVAKDENSDAVYTNNTDMAAESAPLELGYHSSDGVSQDAGIIIRLNHIKGRVWEDMNFDGLQNGPASDSDPMYEKPLSVDVELWKSVDSGKTWGSAPFAKMKSGSSDGTYGYYGNSGGTVGLETGSGVMYQVRFGKPNDGANWAYTEYRTGYPGSAGIDSDALRDTGFTEAITLMAGGNTNIDAGEYKTAAVRGLVWRDADFDGIRQSGDAGYKGVKVNLSYTDLTSASVSLDTATDADGKYSFENLKASRPGTGFTVTFDRSPLTSGTEMYKWAPPNAGSDASVNSDAVYAADAKADLTAAYTSADDPDTADVDEREIKYARAAENIDAGITPYLHVKGFTWHDDDLNGAMNGEEEVFPDIATRLYMDGKQVGETVTGADGSYEFDDILILGREHSVSFDNPDYETWRFTVPGVHHTATDLKGAVAGNINYFKEAHTKGAVLTGHSDSIWNAGLNRIPSYKVTYRPNGGTGPWGPGDYSITVKAGSLVPDQSVNRDGYTFLGWYSTDYLKKNWHFVSDLMPERDIVLDASWQMIPVEKPPAPRRPVNPGQLRNPPVNQDQPGDPVSVPVKKTAKPKPGNAKKPDTYGLGSQGTPGGRGVYDWSLLSLLMSVTAVLIGILAIIGYILKNRWKRYYSEEEQGDEGLPAQTDGEEPGAVEGYYKRSLILRILVCFFGVLTPIIFILLDDMTLPMVWVNLWTPCVALSFVLQLVFLAVYRFRKIKKEEDVEKEDSDE